MSRTNRVLLLDPADPTRYLLYGPTYPAREQIKAAGGRWDAKEGRWWIPFDRAQKLNALLMLAGFDVYAVEPERTKPVPPGPNYPPGFSWADAVVAAICATGDAALADPALKALIGVLHPDRGGSESLTKDLNAARDRLRRLSRR